MNARTNATTMEKRAMASSSFPVALLNRSGPGPAHQPPRQRAGEGAVAIGDLAADDGGAIALCLLLEPPAAARQIMHGMRRRHAQAAEVDHVHIGLVADGQPPAIAKADRARR